MVVDFEHPQIFQKLLGIHNHSKSTTLIILENNLDGVHVIFFWFLLELQHLQRGFVISEA